MQSFLFSCWPHFKAQSTYFQSLVSACWGRRGGRGEGRSVRTDLSETVSAYTWART